MTIELDVYENALTAFDDSRSEEHWRADGSIDYLGSFRRYFRLPWIDPLCFMEVSGGASARGEYRIDRMYRHEVDWDSDSTGVKIYRSRIAEGSIHARPALGFGKRLPAVPMYKAFEIERKLKKSGALSSDLSDTTMLKLAALCGSIESFMSS